MGLKTFCTTYKPIKLVKSKKLIIDILSMSCIGQANLKQVFGIFFGRCKNSSTSSDLKPPLICEVLFLKVQLSTKKKIHKPKV